MSTSNFWVVVWVLSSLFYLMRTRQIVRKSMLKTRRIRELERMVEKLKSTNGNLWYNLMKEKDAATPEPQNELTITRV